MSLQEKLRRDYETFSQELRQAEAKLAEAKKEVDEKQRWMKYVQGLLANSEPPAVVKATPPAKGRTSLPANASTRFSAASLPKAMETLLQEAGVPLPIATLAKRMLEGGYGKSNPKLTEERLRRNIASALAPSARKNWNHRPIIRNADGLVSLQSWQQDTLVIVGHSPKHVLNPPTGLLARDEN